LTRSEREAYDVVVLDRDLPKLHGDGCAGGSSTAAAARAC
jgi:hypothetical protein